MKYVTIPEAREGISVMDINKCFFCEIKLKMLDTENVNSKLYPGNKHSTLQK
jgi:hypothetical protein